MATRVIAFFLEKILCKNHARVLASFLFLYIAEIISDIFNLSSKERADIPIHAADFAPTANYGGSITSLTANSFSATTRFFPVSLAT